MASASYLRPAGDYRRPARRPRTSSRVAARSPRGRYVAGGVLLLALAAIGVAVVLLLSARAALSADSQALASVSLPFGGGTIHSVSVTTGPNSRPVPVTLSGDKIWPRGTLPAHELLDVQVVVTHPGWNAWLTGGSERLHLSLWTPGTRLATPYLTLRSGQPLRVSFRTPVRSIAYGVPGHMRRQTLPTPQTSFVIPHTTGAGSLWVAAAPRTWETARPSVVSWFPAGAAASAVATPAPGSQLTPSSPITLTFSKPVAQALGSARPAISPSTQGSWTAVGSHTLVFHPTGYGWGLGAKISLGLPSGVHLLGATPGASDFTVPPGSTLRLQQILAQLGYLPLSFKGPAVAATPQAEEAAAVKPPAGSFDWRYPNVPAPLRNEWAPGVSGTMTRGALMAFQNDHGLAPDGDPGPQTWGALLTAAMQNKPSTFGYTYVMVDKEASPQTLTLWHNGKTVLTAPVNTGIAQAPTASGTFAVFEHLRVTTMSGTNPDGSHYSDPGIQFVSYFNGGDALHAFTRAQYGFPQSLGCVEMSLGPAGQVWPYTPIGTLVHVA